MPSTSRLAAVALRDFFLATGASSLADAFTALPVAWRIAGVDFAQLEYEFNRLFIGPVPPVAPPYASVYLEKEPRLMGETSQLIARFYDALGLQISIAGMPPDFLALELEAWLALDSGLEETANTDLIRARQFLLAHIGAWLPLFTNRMRSVPLSPAMAKIAALLDEWLNIEKDKI